MQPLESLEIDGYTFTFTEGSNEKTAPAYYWPMSTNTTGKTSIRLYTGNTMTVTAPAGVEFTKLIATPDNSSTDVEIYSGAAVNTYTFTATKTTRINVLKVTVGEGQGGDTPVNPGNDGTFYSGLSSNCDDWTINEGTVPAGLEYVWSWDSKYGLKASAYNSTEQVRYASDIWAISPVIDLSEAESADLKFSQAANYLGDDFSMLITAVREENGEWQSIAVAPLPSGNSWTFVDSSASLTDFIGKKIQIGFNYKSTDTVASTWEIKDLSVTGSKSSAVAEIETAEGVAEYYTLQGVKVANPDNGLYIRVMNGKATKVLVK